MTVQVLGLDSLDTIRSRLLGLGEAPPTAMTAGSEALGVALLEATKPIIASHTPLGTEYESGSDQQHLRDTVTGRIIPGPVTYVEIRETKTVTIRGEPYPLAKLLTEGVDHEWVIESKPGGPALHWRDGDGDHFSRRVTHPAMPPNPYIRDAMLEAEPVITALLAERAPALASSILHVFGSRA